MDLPEHCFYLGKEIVGGIASQLFDAHLVKAKAVSQFRCRGADRGVNVARGEPVNGKSLDQPEGHGFVGGAGKSLVDTALEHLTAINHRPDVGNGAERGVLAKIGPIVIIGYHPRAVIGNIGGRSFLHCK